MRRVPDPDSPRWAHMALYLQSREPSTPGRWMEDYSFLAAYKLKASVRVHNSLYQFVVLALHPNLCWKKSISRTKVVTALVCFFHGYMSNDTICLVSLTLVFVSIIMNCST